MTSKGKIIQEPLWANLKDSDEEIFEGIFPNRKSKRYQLVIDKRFELVGLKDAN